MQYFTKELWQSGQEPGKLNEYNFNWQTAYEKYLQQLTRLRDRLSVEAYVFFAEADLHDGAFVKLELEGGAAQNYSYPVRAKLTATDASHNFLWRMAYGALRRVAIDYPSGSPLFYSPGEGFGDWGYHELTDAGDGFLRHEILFATGSEMLFEFKEFSCEKEPGKIERQVLEGGPDE
jgi:hypothetical protein